jgi:SdrD B-like protein
VLVLPTFLAGLVYGDANQNGTIDNGETGLGGWTVFVDADHDGVLDSDELHLLTDPLGKFAFTSLPAGSYQVRLIPQPGYRTTSPGAGYRVAVLPTSAVNAKLNFGVTPVA